VSSVPCPVAEVTAISGFATTDLTGAEPPRSLRPAHPASVICSVPGKREPLYADFTGVTLTGATTLKLCRLRYVGSARHWQFASCRASHDDYDERSSSPGCPSAPAKTPSAPPGPGIRRTYGETAELRF
jgi:hypothetical protein